MHPAGPSRQLIEQRIRNRLIEYLEMLVSYETDPAPFDLNEALNQWQDWTVHPLTLSNFAPPVYTIEEAECLLSLGSAWENFCESTPNPIKDEVAALVRPEWRSLVSAASRALVELNTRGKRDEEREVSS